MGFHLLWLQIDGPRSQSGAKQFLQAGILFLSDGRRTCPLTLDRLETPLPVRDSSNLIVVDDEDRTGRPPHCHVGISDVDDLPAESIRWGPFSFDRLSTQSVQRR